MFIPVDSSSLFTYAASMLFFFLFDRDILFFLFVCLFSLFVNKVDSPESCDMLHVL